MVRNDSSELRVVVTSILAVVILGFSLYGFGSKFVEFLELARGDEEGAFAITPVVNYLLASLGFICLFMWAVFHGMFSDIERPKHTMLENEEKLDAARRFPSA
jgi:nitrogen fixation-related uncharacterized protein